MHKPQVIIEPATLADWPQIEATRINAFKHEPIVRRMEPVEKQPALDIRIARGVNLRTREAPFDPPYYRFVKATLSSDPSKIVGSAFYWSPVDRTSTGGELLPEEKAAKLERAEKLERSKSSKLDFEDGDGFDMSFIDAFKKDIFEKRRDYFLGKPHWFLELIYVHSDHQGQGVGKALLQWGIDQAESQGVPIYLEATEPGRPVYEKNGFRVVTWSSLPGKDGTEVGAVKWPCMVRDPTTKASSA
ncbi:GNAT domain [Phaffia rhodozyma]|uniref:GNAT domain n=1 Tax=Phaffia rhodozyma TaxID=264483 RepID=A0A0F7SEU1_PHARH|nr:GNAT domain [Phaffia rhodozyma]